MAGRILVAECHSLGALVELLALHSPVLKPDFDLSLGEMKPAGDFPAFLTRYVRVADELLLQDHRLVARIRLTLLALSARLGSTQLHRSIHVHGRRLTQYLYTSTHASYIHVLVTGDNPPPRRQLPFVDKPPTKNTPGAVFNLDS